MSERKFKVGDIVSLKAVAIKGAVYHRMVVEQVFDRGKSQHVLCSYLDESWMPGFFTSEYLELTE